MEKFWSNEDLVEELLPFLDLPSIVALALVHPLSLALVQRGVVWQGILLKTFKAKSEILVQQQWEEKVDLLMNLMSDDPEDGHLLLHHICQNFPPTPSNHLDKELIRVSFKGKPAANEKLLSADKVENVLKPVLCERSSSRVLGDCRRSSHLCNLTAG